MFLPNKMLGSKLKLIDPLWWFLFFIVSTYRFISRPFPSRCRFHPTCSAYARDAIYEYWSLHALYLIIVRLSKCHPFNPGGIDYIKKNHRK